MKTCTPFNKEEYKDIVKLIEDVDDWLDWISGTADGPALTMEIAKTRLILSRMIELIESRVDSVIDQRTLRSYRSVASAFRVTSLKKTEDEEKILSSYMPDIFFRA